MRERIVVELTLEVEREFFRFVPPRHRAGLLRSIMRNAITSGAAAKLAVGEGFEVPGSSRCTAMNPKSNRSRESLKSMVESTDQSKLPGDSMDQKFSSVLNVPIAVGCMVEGYSLPVTEELMPDVVDSANSQPLPREPADHEVPIIDGMSDASPLNENCQSEAHLKSRKIMRSIRDELYRNV